LGSYVASHCLAVVPQSGAKIMSPGGNLTALSCHPTKKVNKAEELTYLSTNIASIINILDLLHSLL